MRRPAIIAAALVSIALVIGVWATSAPRSPSEIPRFSTVAPARANEIWQIATTVPEPARTMYSACGAMVIQMLARYPGGKFPDSGQWAAAVRAEGFGRYRVQSWVEIQDGSATRRILWDCIAEVISSGSVHVRELRFSRVP